MLFGYPLAATEENWLHECLCGMVQIIHNSLNAGNDPPPWPDIIPAAHRDQLRIRTGLRSRLGAYRAALTELTQEQRDRVLNTLEQQNRISELCSCAADCDDIGQLPGPIREPIIELFGFAFQKLEDFGIRDRQYELIYNDTNYHVCPFCGCEYFDAPGAPREDLDHYIPRSLYPFAAVNLRNLVPMGMRCNERYKKSQDILRKADGTRRPAFDPYSDVKIEVRLTSSIPFAGDDGQAPDWVIEFSPNSQKCETWNEVFDVKERVKRDVLNPSFRRWLGEFADWFKKEYDGREWDSETVLDAVQKYVEIMKSLGLNAREFLRAPMFQMLYQHCTNGNDRLNNFMVDLVST